MIIDAYRAAVSGEISSSLETEVELRLKEQQGRFFVRVTSSPFTGKPVWLPLEKAEELLESLGDMIWLAKEMEQANGSSS